MSYGQQKAEILGNVYFNFRKDTPREVVQEICGAINFLREQKVFLTLDFTKSGGSQFTGNFSQYESKNGTAKAFITKTQSQQTNAPQSSGYQKRSYGNNPGGGYRRQQAAPQAPMADPFGGVPV